MTTLFSRATDDWTMTINPLAPDLDAVGEFCKRCVAAGLRPAPLNTQLPISPTTSIWNAPPRVRMLTGNQAPCYTSISEFPNLL